MFFLVVQNGWKVAGLKIIWFNFCGWTQIWRTLLWEFGDKVPFFVNKIKLFFSFRWTQLLILFLQKI